MKIGMKKLDENVDEYADELRWREIETETERKKK